jgi:hypothetical protein
MTMRESLERNKKSGLIDFIEVPVRVGHSHHEFIGFALESKKFFIIFYDNKYREDTLKPNLAKQEEELAELKKGLTDIGIYNTTDEYNRKKEEVDFYKKYLPQNSHILTDLTY